MKITNYPVSIFLMMFSCLIMGPGTAQAQNYDFQNFTVEDGLSQSQILCLFQIATGELWMGTNQGGINKYNGSEFSHITKEQGLSDNVVYCMAQNQRGQVLVGTHSGLNILTGHGIRILNTDHGLPHAAVVSLLISRSQEVWLGTGKGVALLVGDSIRPFNRDSTLSASTVLNIREGSDGNIWFCTVQNGLFRWDGTTMANINMVDGLGHNYVYDVMPLGKYDAWIFGHNGLYHLRNREVEKLKVKGIADNTIFYGYQRDQAKNIWIGSSAGVLKYRNNEFTRLSVNNGLVNNNIWKILQDREGNLWFGSKTNGVSKLNSERFKIYQSEADSLPDPTINAVFRDDRQRLWLGTKRGLTVWDGDKKKIYRETDGLASEVVRDFDIDPNGNIYIATDYGVSVYNGSKFTSFTSETKNLNSCWDIYVDGQTVWLGTNEGPAVLEKGQISQPYNAVAFKKSVFDAVRKDGDIWFGYDDGVLRFDGQKFTQLKAKDGFFDGRCRSIALGPNGDLWFGTNDGVYSYDGVSCRNYGVKDGMLSDAVYSLGFDQSGGLWVGQSKGLSRLMFDGKELEDVIVYGKEQGFQGLECSTNSIWMEKDGRIWVGTSTGLVEYDPALDKGTHFKPLTRITDIKLFSQPVNWKLYADSVSADGLPINLILPYDRNHLTFDYSGVSLTSPASINYTYILEGLDADWQPITNNSSAKYSNIPPGEYTFKVRAGFGDELWKNVPVSFSFRISAPWYRTTWFYLVCVALGLGIAYSYYTIRRANVQITEQKQKIESQKDVIEKKNREMVDSINYASTIQSAILPSEESWYQLLPDSFVLYRPKDIVSGDFYWLGNNNEGDVFFSSVDCTGHGVPGALMSIVGYNGLNQAINEHHLNEPASILNYLSNSVNESLRKSEHDNYVRDGMDIALCKLNRQAMKLEFAGAFNPLLIVRGGQEMLIKGDRIAIGNMDTERRSFTNHEVALQKGDCIYVYSDGYADQFGGADGKKMKTAVMRQKLLEVSTLPMHQQQKALETHLSEWMGQRDQVDDICIIGVRV